MGRVAGTTLAIIYALSLAQQRDGGAQAITRDNYYDYLPRPPKIVAQTRASAALHLFGDRRDAAFVDADPRDGIDDARGRRLVELGGRYFAGLLPRRDSSVTALALTHGGAFADEASATRDDVAGTRLWFNLYFGERFSLENTFSWATGGIGYNLRDGEGSLLGTVRGDLYMRQLTGGVRYDVVSAANHLLRLYGRAGYGWLWYEGHRFHISGSDGDGPLQNPSAKGGYLPPLLPSVHWWPNTVYAGLGAEAFSPQRLWILGRLGVGVRAEFTELFNKLTFDDASSGRGDVTSRRGDLAFSLVFGW